MPRLSPKDYIDTHRKLRRLWLDDPSLFAELSPTEQWSLHDFFAPTTERTDLELISYRRLITADRPSLPHMAGRALSHFWETTARVGVKRVATAKKTVPAKRVRQQDRRLTVKPLSQPEIDPKKLARAFINLAYDRARKQAVEDEEYLGSSSNSKAA